MKSIGYWREMRLEGTTNENVREGVERRGQK
jgi:hypothetical protein